MTPFIIRLEKEDIDNLLNMLVKVDNSISLENVSLEDKDLVIFIESLMQQNSELLNLLKKIDFFGSKNKMEIDHIKGLQKCEVHRALLNKILVHCAIHDKNFKNSVDSMTLLGCDNCSFNNSDKFRNN